MTDQADSHRTPQPSADSPELTPNAEELEDEIDLVALLEYGVGPETVNFLQAFDNRLPRGPRSVA